MLAWLAATALSATAPVFVEQPCRPAELTGKARCGTVAVPEDRSRRGRRTIRLNVIVIPASGERRLPPLFDIDGGPSIADTKNTGFYLTDGARYHEHRDVVLVDQRGTGGSNGLKCPELDAAEAAYQPMYPLNAVRRCRAELEKRADLRLYGTTEGVADLDAVRTALGYDRIDLFALSYGTLFALRYLATHPSTVRAAVLLSVAPPAAMPPRYHAQAAERGLAALFSQCRADPGCGKAYDPDKDLAAALARLPTIPGAPPGDVFMEKLRSLLYVPRTGRTVPYLVHAAANGDLKPFLEATRPHGPSLFNEGMYLSVTCTESFPLFDYAPAAAAARRTRFGDYRLSRQRAACALWPKGKVPADFLKAPRTSAAVLILSGPLDPVTPPAWGASITRALPHARQVIIPEMAHIPDGLSGVDTCFDPMLLRFYDTGDVGHLDTSCVAHMTPPPFKTAGAR
jgi:pimeloyl-ACP methyl ester carboxylesterase